MGVCAQLKEQTVGWFSNNTKNTTNPGFWHTESDGEHWGGGQIKAGHVGNGLWLSSPPHQSAPVFIIIQQDLSLSKACVFINIFKSEDEKQ